MALNADIGDQREGRIFGLIALLALIIGAGFCAYFDQKVLGLAFLGAGALGTIGHFFKRKTAA